MNYSPFMERVAQGRYYSLILTPLFLFSLAFSILFPPASAHAGLRGMPEGKASVQVGDNAPLESADLKKANEEEQVIFLMFGNTQHCIYCEKVWFNLEDLVGKYGKENIAAILKQHRASKFWGPESEDVRLGKLYGVIGEPWLFLIDRKGIIRHIFMGFTGLSEIEAELKRVLEEDKEGGIKTIGRIVDEE